MFFLLLAFSTSISALNHHLVAFDGAPLLFQNVVVFKRWLSLKWLKPTKYGLKWLSYSFLMVWNGCSSPNMLYFTLLDPYGRPGPCRLRCRCGCGPYFKSSLACSRWATTISSRHKLMVREFWYVFVVPKFCTHHEHRNIFILMPIPSCSKNQIKLFKMFKRYRKCAKWKSCWRFSKRKMLSHLPRPIYGWFLLPQEEPAIMAFLAIYIILVFIFLMFLGTTRSCLRPSSQFNGDSFYGETWFITVANLTINGISPCDSCFVFYSHHLWIHVKTIGTRSAQTVHHLLQIKPMIFAWKSTLGEL